MDQSLRNFRALFLLVVCGILAARVLALVELGPFNLLTTIGVEVLSAVLLTGTTLGLLVPVLQKRFGFQGSLSAPRSRWERSGHNPKAKKARGKSASEVPPPAAPAKGANRKQEPADLLLKTSRSSNPGGEDASPPQGADTAKKRPSANQEQSFGDWRKTQGHSQNEKPWHQLRPGVSTSGRSHAPKDLPQSSSSISPSEATIRTPDPTPEPRPTPPDSPLLTSDPVVDSVSGFASVSSPNRPLLDCLRSGVGDSLEKIRAFTDVLLEEHQDGLTDEGRLCLTKLAKNTKMAQTTLGSLVDFLDLAQTKNQLREVDPTSILDDLVRDLVELTRENQVQVEIGKNLPSVVADETKLTIALRHLLENAIKFNNKSDRMVKVHADRDGDRVTLTINDNGIGVDVGEEKAIFEPFVRGLRAGLFEGTGLGLTTVKTLIEGMGGSVGVQSIPGEGSTFLLTLPTFSDSPAPEDSTVPDVSCRYNKKQIRPPQPAG